MLGIFSMLEYSCYDAFMDKKELATFAAGCFWGVEEMFRNIRGVEEVISGYSGGHVDHPTYEQVCTGTTGHAESVQVTFDPSVVEYATLLRVFWSIHNPTIKDRQGPNIGNEYRSIIFFHNSAQERAAHKSKEDLEASGTFADPIVTEIIPFQVFWPAEEYHQQFLRKHNLGSCHI